MFADLTKGGGLNFAENLAAKSASGSVYVPSCDAEGSGFKDMSFIERKFNQGTGDEGCSPIHRDGIIEPKFCSWN